MVRLWRIANILNAVFEQDVIKLDKRHIEHILKEHKRTIEELAEY